MTDYLLDANVFIQAKNLHYGFDFCPAFWDWLDERNPDGKVASIEKVADELHAGADELADWADARGDRFFLRPNDMVVPALRTASDWESTQDYESAAGSALPYPIPNAAPGGGEIRVGVFENWLMSASGRQSSSSWVWR